MCLLFVCASSLIFDSKEPNETTESPPIEDIEKEYSEIFSKPSPADEQPFGRMAYGMDCSYTPISEEAICEIQRSLKHSAPGPDGLTVAHFKTLSPKLLCVVYIIMLLSGYVPPALKLCRTTLIPKSQDTAKIGNWRPITVSSIILRVLNKILASRLGHLKINSSQRGFRNLDGCTAKIPAIAYAGDLVIFGPEPTEHRRRSTR